MFAWRQDDDRPRRIGAWACLFLLLVVSSVQACHVCGLEGTSQQPHSLSAQQATTSSSDVCLICLSSQPASARASLAGLSILFVPKATAVAQQPLLLSAETLFALYIRPPPSH